MNRNVLFLIVLMLPALSASSQSHRKSIQQLNWLEGTWTRTNSKTGQSGFEAWNKISSTELRGRGITMRGSDTIFVEKIRIIGKGIDLYYVADVPENEKPVYFRLTELKENGFTCENPEHDFPKKITYSLKGNTLRAIISGNGKSIDYLFEKNEN